MDADHLLALDKIKNWSKSAATSLQNRLAIFISQRHAQRRCSKYKRREATAVLQLFYVPDSKTKTICYEKGLFEQVEPIQKAGKSPKSILDGHWAATQKAMAPIRLAENLTRGKFDSPKIWLAEIWLAENLTRRKLDSRKFCIYV